MKTLEELQKLILAKYCLKLELENLNKMRKIVKDLKKLDRLGINSRNYTSKYLEKYKNLVYTADDIGITIKEKPLQKPSELKARLFAIFVDLKLTERQRNYLLTSMNLRIQRKPKQQDIKIYLTPEQQSNSYDDWSNYTPSKEESFQVEQLEKDYLAFLGDQITY